MVIHNIKRKKKIQARLDLDFGVKFPPISFTLSSITFN
jgi:hypothetical protein